MKCPFTVKIVLFIWFLLPRFGLAQEKTPFREVLKPAELAERVAALKEQVADSIYLADETNFPLIGIKLTGISRRSNAEKAGIPEGSIVYRRGGQMEWGGYLPPIIHRDSYLAEFVNPDGSRREVELEGGLMGSGFEGEYRLDIAYLRGKVGVREPEWDRQILIACLTQRSDPATAETALFHALKAGYREDDLTAFFQILFHTISKDGPERQMDRFLSYFKGKNIPPVYLPPLQNVMAVTGRIDYMKRIAAQVGDNAAFDPGTIEKFLQWTGGKTQFPAESLLQRALAKKGVSIAGKFQSRLNGRRPKEESGMGKELHLPAEQGRTRYCNYSAELGPDSYPHNFHYHATVQLSAPQKARRTPFARIAISRTSSKEFPLNRTSRFPRRGMPFYERLIYARIDRTPAGTLITTSGDTLPGITAMPSPLFTVPFTGAEENPGESGQQAINREKEKSREPLNFDLIRLGPEIGIFINGICYLHLPTDPSVTRKFQISLYAYSMEMELSNQDLRELKN